MESDKNISLNIYGEQNNIAINKGRISANQSNIVQSNSAGSNIITYGQDITYTNNFVGRENEVNQIIQKLEGNKRILISGMGGIGKTTILKKIYHTMVDQHKNTNKKLGYFEYKLSMDDTIYNAMAFDKTDDRTVDIQMAKRLLEDYANSSGVVIFIDNVPAGKYNELQQLNSINGQIVITSRQNEFENYETVFIDKMSTEECKEIFEKESGLSRYSGDLDYIINNLINQHTLTVKLLAKITKKKQWTITELKEKLIEKGFRIEYKESGKSTNILFEYKKLYLVSQLNRQEQNILEGFSLLREAKLDKSRYRMFLAKDADDIDGDELYELYEKGWLEKDGDKFTIHPVFAEFISESKEISIHDHENLYDKIKLMCSDSNDLTLLSTQEYLIELVSFGKNVSLKDNVGDEVCNIAFFAMHFADYNNAVALLQRITMDDVEIFIKVQLILCDVYVQTSKFKEAKECLDNCLNSGINGIKNKDLFIEYKICYALYLAKRRQSNEDRKEAIRELESILKLEMDEVIRGRIFNCLGGIYTDLERNRDNLDNALRWHKEAEKIREKYDTKIADLARTYNNLGRVYYYLAEYSDKDENLEYAERYYWKSLRLRRQIYNDDHPGIARIFVNLGNVYMMQEKYEEALQYMKRGLEIRIKILGDHTWEVGLTYHNMVKVYIGLYDTENACRCAEKAQEICLSLYGPDSDIYKKMCESHSYIIAV